MKIDCRLAVTDSPVGDLPYLVKCREPDHHDSTESFAIYRDHAHCYGCPLHISKATETLAYLLYGNYCASTVHELWMNKELLSKYTAAAIDGYRTRVREEVASKPLPKAQAGVYESILWGIRQSSVHWLFSRGLSYQALENFHIGHNGTAFTIPVYDKEGRLLTFRYRSDFDVSGKVTWDNRPIPKYYGMSGRNVPFLFPLDKLHFNRPTTVYVVEGELDAIRLWQEDIPAVTITNGGGNMQKIPEMLERECDYVRTVVLIGDMDERGRVATDLCYKQFDKRHYNVQRVSWDLQQGKDITEYLKENRLCDLGIRGQGKRELSYWI